MPDDDEMRTSIQRRVEVNPELIAHGAVTEEDWFLIVRSIEHVVHRLQDAGVDYEDARFVEVGTLSAKTTRGILDVLEELRYPAMVTTIDKYPTARAHFNVRCGGYKNTEIRIGLSAEVLDELDEISPRVYWAFIDGCHCEGCVTKDIEALGKYLPIGGVIVFHDADPRNRMSGMNVHKRYHNDGVVRPYGVTKAIASSPVMAGFELIGSSPAMLRPPGAPTPFFGGVRAYKRMVIG